MEHRRPNRVGRVLYRHPAVWKVQFLLAREARRLPPVHAALRRLFSDDLRKLNDTLASVGLERDYWMWSGIVLGWAREGRILLHDDMDADFAILDCNWERFEQIAPVLERAGFRGHLRYRNYEGQTTQLVFVRHGTRFEFFRMDRRGEMLQYYVYGQVDGAFQELRRSVPYGELEEFSFLCRRWLKMRDHERELKWIYGDWRVPDVGWRYLDNDGDGETVQRPWDPATAHW